MVMKGESEVKRELYHKLQSVMKEEGEVKRELYQKLQAN